MGVLTNDPYYLSLCEYGFTVVSCGNSVLLMSMLCGIASSVEHHVLF